MDARDFLAQQRGQPSSLDASRDGAHSARISELIDRRSPFARAEFVYGVIPASTTFTVEHTLRLSPEDRLLALVVGAAGDVRVWKNPSDVQRPGTVTLRCSAAGISFDLLLVIPRP